MPSRRFCGNIQLAALLLLVYGLTGLWVLPAAARAGECELRIEVDARDLPRRLLHTSLRIACEPGPLVLWYPKWIPGTQRPAVRWTLWAACD